MRIVCALFLTLAAAEAQVGPTGYPPGYPGASPYPGGRTPTGPSIPAPGKRGKQKDAKAYPGQPLPSFRGILKQMDAKTVTLELDDFRILEFKRTDKTKFFKEGEELKSPQFNPGDLVSVEGPYDQAGFLTAVNVYWEKAATAVKAGDAGVIDTWKDESAKSQAEPARATAPAPPAKPDADDPGPPQLRRGRPADLSRETSAPVPELPVSEKAGPPSPDEPVAVASLPSVIPGDDSLADLQRPMDPLIRRAADAALDFTETLPAYNCQQMVARYSSDTKPASWHALDVLSATVVYEKGKEDYRNITVNGKASGKTFQELGGAWSTGEFGTVLIDLFSPASAAEFHYRKDARIAGLNTKQYDFNVKRENSHWNVHMGSQVYSPAYRGSVWIDPASARVMRIEMQALGFPDDFPVDHMETATDYQFIRLGGMQQFLLPVHAEILGCQRSSLNCFRNLIDFRNYHKYSGESNIQYETVDSNVQFGDDSKEPGQKAPEKKPAGKKK